ncbi:MAG: hypothetical protein GY939_24905 [Actinomycetia bacterium]|nr:hypothetical protein [Actinomycetes bacterium]
MTEPAALYAQTRDRFIGLARSLDPDQATQQVPLTPEWRITDVAAHLCGINSDIITGRLDDLGSDAWTARQVSERAGHTIDQICEEWSGHASAMDTLFIDNPYLATRLIGDLIVHLHDVEHALGRPIDGSDEATLTAAHRHIPQLKERVLDRIGARIRVELIDGRDAPLGADEGAEPTLVLRASAYDFVRSVTGRRSRGQVEALNWTGDPTSVLDQAWSAYGPIRQDDVGV